MHPDFARVNGWLARTATLSLPLAIALITGCGRAGDKPAKRDATEANGWTQVNEAAFSAAQRAQYERAIAARDAMMGRLGGRLTEMIKKEGPAAAIAVCQGEAPQIAKSIAGDYDVSIGRTSFRLRHPANQPPEWAVPLVEARNETIACLAHDDGRLAVLSPIRVQEKCLTCHGSEDQIPGEVRERLHDLYPQDKATGFAEGDLRGWFWIEAPATAASGATP